MVGIAVGANLIAIGQQGATGAPAVLSAVQADGWQGVWAGGTPPTFDPDNAPVCQTFSRQGFDATATAITFSESLAILCRVRQPYPNQTLPTASNVALQDYVLSTDSAAGVTNSSTEISPKPIGNWVMRDRQLVGNSIDWEIIAFHYYARNGRQVPCVRVRANDGTNQTPWQVVSSTVVSTYCEDVNAVEVYRGTLDVTALADGPASAPTLCWLEAEIMPWVGADNATYAQSSVLKSEQSSVIREFSRRYFGKSTARAASPPLAYVASTGNDSTGVWSTTAATALATPFLTVGGAMMAMDVAVRGTPATNNILDGCRIRIVDTINIGTASTSRAQRVAAVCVERAPGTARSAAIVTMGASMRCRLGVGSLYSPLTEGAILFEDVTINRTGAFTFTGESANQLQIHLRNVAFPNSDTAKITSNSHLYTYGVVMPNSPTVIGAIASEQKRLLRGLTMDGAFAQSVHTNCVVACNITRPTSLTYIDPGDNHIVYSNKWLNPSSSSGVGGIASTVSGSLLGPIVWMHNIIEATHTTDTTAGIRISNDSPAYGSVTHAVIHHNTDTGYGGVNRENMIYDQSPIGKSPPHKFFSYVGNLASQLNNKGDVFTLDGTRLANFAFSHGVGCRGTFTQFRPASGALSSELQTFPGLNCNIGTSPDTRNDPLFVNYQGTGGSGGIPTTGAGGGDYNLQGGSPARNRVTIKTRSFAIDGTAVAATDSAGAYA